MRYIPEIFHLEHGVTVKLPKLSNETIEAEVRLHLLLPGPREPSGEVGVLQYVQHGFSEGLRILSRNKQPIDAVYDDFRSSANAGGDHREPGRHRFEHGIGHCFGL